MTDAATAAPRATDPTAGLSGRVACVTGASSGIGRAIARHLAAHGAEIFLTGRSIEALGETQALIRAAGGHAEAEAFDLRPATRLQDFVAKIAQTRGALHIMVNAAGLEFVDTIADGKPAEWQEMVDTNILALLAGSQAAIRAMRATQSQGHIVNISSIAARTDASGVYGATKAAVNAIGATLRKELEDEPIRAVTIMPGATVTNFGRNFPPEFVNGLLLALGLPAAFNQGARLPDEAMAEIARRAAPMLATADDVARAVVYAVSQPITLNIAELVVRPQKGFATPTRTDG